MATTIPAGTFRLLLTSISYRAKARKEMRREPPMVPRRPPRSCCWTARRVEGARPQAAGRGKYRDRRRADRVQVETLTPQQVRRVCTADSVSALVSDLQTAGADPAGLAWSVICCTVWHRSITGVRPYIHYYNGAAVLTCTAPRRGGGIWYRCGASGRFDTLQRGAGGIIAACVGLVSRVAE